jgi:hypothetical protein
MKTPFLVLSLTVLLSAACSKSDPEPSEEKRVTSILTQNAAQWAPSAAAGITVNGVDVTQTLFKDFSISFTADRLFTTGTTPVWLREDTWTFKDNTATVMIRGQDGKEIKIESISETELQLSLQWDKTTYAENGKTESIPGTFVFTLKK